MKNDEQPDDLSVSTNLEILNPPFEKVAGNSQIRDQRHLSAEKVVAGKQQSVKGRIKAIENKDFNTLYRNSSPKVKRESIRIKSPKISSKSTPKKGSKLSDKKLDKKTLRSGHKTPKSTNKTSKIEANYSKVRQLIANFDKNVDPVSSDKLENKSNDCNELDFLDASNRKGACINAFERLMMTKKGDTLPKTPVRRRIKRLEKGDFSTSGQKMMDLRNWARKKP